MCGITVYISKKEYENDEIQNVSHRGPDNTNILKFKFQKYFITCVFHRLAIIDVAHGNQPFEFKDHDRNVILLCNGEIYNYLDIIKKYNFETKSDCHVILDLYLIKGIEQTVKELDGEFSFILFDYNSDNMKIYYCRDRFGIRPLFSFIDESGFYFSSELKGLPFHGLGHQVEPRTVFSFNINNENSIKSDYFNYYEIGRNGNIVFTEDERTTIYQKIRESLIKSVKDRLQSERDIGALLSGGLDSSLVCAIASRILKKEGKKLKTFSIGIEESSPDIQNARKVAEFINSDHHEIIIPIEKWLECLKVIPKIIESYDITTVRATTGQFLVAKWIKENTNVKVLLVGDGSDEIAAGYRYFGNSPTSIESHEECIRLLSNIHYYDVLRCDRGISYFGLECRVPFLCHNFVDFYLSINPDERSFKSGVKIEKELIRKSFENENILPIEVLFRPKEAFSDGISNVKKSFFEYITDFVSNNDSDIGKFPTKEAKFYYDVFMETYPNNYEFNGYWLPKWSGKMTEPSARCLPNY